MKNKTKTPTKRKVVKRHTRNYQFRDEHLIDQHIESILDFWKHERREITNLRKAVALYYALEQGDLSVLFDSFPQYKTQFAPGTAEALEQFMQILKQQQQPAAIGAGQSTTYNPPIPLPETPAVEVKPLVPVSDELLFDNFVSLF